MADWKQTINLADVFHNEKLTFEQRRDAIVKCLTNSRWPEKNDRVYDLVFDLQGADSVDEFDEIWDAIYDEADADKVWIKIR